MAEARQRTRFVFQGEGGPAISRTLQNIGATGDSAFNRLNRSSRAAQGGLAGLDIGVIAIRKSFILASAVIGTFTAAFSSSIRSASAFQSAFANVTTLLDTTQVNTEKLRNELLLLPPVLGSSKDLAEGLYETLSAGVEPARAVRFVGEAALFAKAAIIDTKTSVDVLTTVLNAYGTSASEASRVSDILFTAIRLGKTRGQELAQSLGDVIPVASSLGITIDEVANSIAVLTAGGLATSRATTALRSLFSQLIQNAQKFRDAGIDVTKILRGPEGFIGLLNALRNTTGGNVEAIRVLVNDIEGLGAALTLTGTGLEKLESQAKQFNESLGATATAAGKQFTTLKTATDSFSNAIDRITNRVGPFFINVLTTVIALLEDFLDLVGVSGALIPEEPPIIKNIRQSITAVGEELAVTTAELVSLQNIASMGGLIGDDPRIAALKDLQRQQELRLQGLDKELLAAQKLQSRHEALLDLEKRRANQSDKNTGALKDQETAADFIRKSTEGTTGSVEKQVTIQDRILKTNLAIKDVEIQRRELVAERRQALNDELQKLRDIQSGPSVNLLLQKPIIDPERELPALINLEELVTQHLQGIPIFGEAQVTQAANDFERIFENAGENIQRGIGDNIFDALTGRTSGDGIEQFTNLLKDTVARVLAETVTEALLNSASSAAVGQGFSNLFGTPAQRVGGQIAQTPGLFQSAGSGRDRGTGTQQTSGQTAGSIAGGIGLGVGAGFLTSDFLAGLGLTGAGNQALSGAVGGAAAGSLFGPIGTIAGALLGALIGGLAGTLGGRPDTRLRTRTSAGFAGFESNTSASGPFGNVGLSEVFTQRTNPEFDKGIAEFIQQVDELAASVLTERQREIAASAFQQESEIGLNRRGFVQVDFAGEFDDEAAEIVRSRLGSILDFIGGFGLGRQVLGGIPDLESSIPALQQAFTEAINVINVIESIEGTLGPVTKSGQALEAINAQFDELSDSARRFGLSFETVEQARDQQIQDLVSGFNQEIQDQILGIVDPEALQLQGFERLRDERIREAEELGGDIVAIERLFLLQRQQLLEEGLTEQSDTIANLINRLTGTTRSPLPGEQVLESAQRIFSEALSSGIQSTIADSAQNLLDVGREIFASGPQFFEIFNSVLDRLRGVEADLGSNSLNMQSLEIAQGSQNTLVEIGFMSQEGNTLLRSILEENRVLRQEFQLLRTRFDRLAALSTAA